MPTLAPWATFQFHVWNVEKTSWPWNMQGFYPDQVVGVPESHPQQYEQWRTCFGDALLPFNTGGQRWSGSLPNPSSDPTTSTTLQALAGLYWPYIPIHHRELVSTVNHPPPEGYTHVGPPSISHLEWIENQTLYPVMWVQNGIRYFLEGVFDQVESKQLQRVHQYYEAVPIAPIVGAGVLIPLLLSAMSAGNIGSQSPARRRRRLTARASRAAATALHR